MMKNVHGYGAIRRKGHTRRKSERYIGMLLLMCNNVLNLLCNYVLKTQKRDLNTMSISCSFTNTISAFSKIFSISK